MKISLQNQTVLITGASKGIGREIAKCLSSAGASIAIHYNKNKHAADLLANEIKNNSKSFGANLSLTNEAERLFSEVINHFGKIDLLINNAGIYEYSPISDENWYQKWERTITTNLNSAGLLCKLAIEHFLTINGGRIINIASRAAHRGDTGDYLSYAASKGGLVALTKTIARSFGKNNIMAFSVSPGFVRTEMAEEFIKINGEEKVTGDIALPKLTEVTDIAPTILFLASGHMDHSTGNTIDINAGSYMR